MRDNWLTAPQTTYTSINVNGILYFEMLVSLLVGFANQMNNMLSSNFNLILWHSLSAGVLLKDTIRRHFGHPEVTVRRNGIGGVFTLHKVYLKRIQNDNWMIFVYQCGF